MTDIEQYCDILANFDFEKVQAYMESVNWTWADPVKPSAVPTVEEIQELAKELITDVIFNGVPSASTGGLLALRNGDHVSLIFCLEEWDTAFNEIEAPSDPF